MIRTAKPDVLLVALGAPRQDEWIAANRERLGVPVSIGVGGTLDVLSGRSARAPSFMRALGFEWLFRLAREPRRLWRRYVLGDLPAFVHLMRGAISSRHRFDGSHGGAA